MFVITEDQYWSLPEGMRDKQIWTGYVRQGKRLFVCSLSSKDLIQVPGERHPAFLARLAKLNEERANELREAGITEWLDDIPEEGDAP